MDGFCRSGAPRVLLVEDDPALAYALEHELLELGAEVMVAGDGQAALRLLTDEILTLDLLVTDLELPALDGFGLVHLLRQTCGEKDLAILAIADHVSFEIQAKFRAQGVEVLPKNAGLKAVAAEARRLLQYSGRLAEPPRPLLGDDTWTALPQPRGAGVIGRIKL